MTARPIGRLRAASRGFASGSSFVRSHPCTAAAAATCLCLGLTGRQSPRAQINYGTHMGTEVSYVNVTEDSGADEPLPLYGPPTVTGNSIDFNPTGFDAASSNGGSDVTDSNLVVRIVAKPGFVIESVQLSEAGDTTMAGNVPPGSMGTATAVFASGVLDIYEVNNQPINHISVPFSMSFTPSGGTFFLGTDGGGGPIFNTQWNGSVTIPVEQILIANGFDLSAGGGATHVSVDLDNTLTAVSERGTSALIEKKDFGGLTVTTFIPEPTAGALAGVAGLALLGRRARRPRQP